MQAPRCMTTLIGSMPHSDPERAIEAVLEAAPEAPIWPQLPNLGWREGFLAQYSEGLPGLFDEPQQGKVHLDTGPDSSEALAAFYERSLAVEAGADPGEFAISKIYAAGLYKALKRFAELESKPQYAKVHVTGPVSFGLTATDMDDRPLFYDDSFADVISRQLAAKARWQIRLFKNLADGVICFFDEPSLSAFGSSSYINVGAQDVLDRLSPAIDSAHEEGAIVGVHVCGNTEWPLLIDAGADILNFDAYGYGESITAYAARIAPFLEGGGVLAWGLVPTSREIRDVDGPMLFDRLKVLVKMLDRAGVDSELVWKQSMLTPSCGMGTMSVEDTERVLVVLADLGKLAQKKARA